MIEFHYPVKLLNKKIDHNIHFGNGSYNYFQIINGREIPFESGRFEMKLKAGELFLVLINSFTNQVRYVRIDYFNKEIWNYSIKILGLKVFLDKMQYYLKERLVKQVTITSDPPVSAVYANEDYIGKSL